MMAMCPDGTRVTNPKALASGTMGLRRLDQAIARIRNIHGKSNLSNRRERLYAGRRTLQARIVNGRNDNHRRATTSKARSAGQVVVETLNVSGMVRNRQLSSSDVQGDCRCPHGRVPDQAGVPVRLVWG